jgi:hypothetical protein
MRTDEHLWGQWIRKYAGELPASRISHVAGFATSPSGLSFLEIPTVTTTNKASALHIITREVCRDCNTGWMSRLETETKPVILALAGADRDTTRLVLDTAEARTLARWAQKTAITCELTGDAPFRVATVAMGRRLRGGSPLRSCIVWAARNVDDYWPATAQVHATIGATPRPVPGEQDRHGLLTMIVWRYLTLMVFIAGDHGNLPALIRPRWRWTAGRGYGRPPPRSTRRRSR